MRIEGTLVGVNVRTGVFKLYDDSSNQKYAGKAIDGAKGQLMSLTTGERYRAHTLREVEVSGANGDVKYKYRLTHIEAA